MKKFKGFTLIECIIAMAILGIASTIMAGIYGSVARMNANNHLVNTSLSNQMAYVEKYTNTEAVAVYYNESGGASAPDPKATDAGGHVPPAQSTSGVTNPDKYVAITRLDASGNKVTSETYSYPIDLYVLYSRDKDDNHAADEDNYDLRYRYLIGH